MLSNIQITAKQLETIHKHTSSLNGFERGQLAAVLVKTQKKYLTYARRALAERNDNITARYWLKQWGIVHVSHKALFNKLVIS